MNGAPDSLIGSTAANIARHCSVDFRVRGLGVLRKQRSGGHDLAGLAITTLGYLFSDPCRLERMCRRRRQPFDRSDLLRSYVRHRHATGSDRCTINVDGTGAALLQAAAKLSSRQSNRVANHPEQWRVGTDIHIILLAINSQGNHMQLLPFPRI
jgi:hypothetical protein